MPYDPARHHRRSIRLHGYDYSRAGAYFVTILVKNRECLFGEVAAERGEMHLSEIGRVVQLVWDELPGRYPVVELDAFVVMPNHVHGIIVISGDTGPVGAIHELPLHELPAVGAIHELPLHELPAVGAIHESPLLHESPLQDRAQRRQMLLPKIVGYFKMNAAKRANEIRSASGAPLWQRNYYEHIIRDDADLRRIREYIANNPLKWELDQLHPANPSKW